jgi:tRNA(Glu) U13 pseudouridine synthase TruD
VEAVVIYTILKGVIKMDYKEAVKEFIKDYPNIWEYHDREEVRFAWATWKEDSFSDRRITLDQLKWECPKKGTP